VHAFPLRGNASSYIVLSGQLEPSRKSPRYRHTNPTCGPVLYGPCVHDRRKLVLDFLVRTTLEFLSNVSEALGCDPSHWCFACWLLRQYHEYQCRVRSHTQRHYLRARPPIHQPLQPTPGIQRQRLPRLSRCLSRWNLYHRRACADQKRQRYCNMGFRRAILLRNTRNLLMPSLPI